MNKKIILLIIVFLLFVPFRLPIAVLFINAVTSIATITGALTETILVANIIVTKLIYNLILSILSIYNIEMLSRKIKKRNPQVINYEKVEETLMFWWTGFIIVFFIAYVVFDTAYTYDLFFILYK